MRVEVTQPCPEAGDGRHVWNERNVCALCDHDPLAAVRAAQSALKRSQRARRSKPAPRQPKPGTMRLRPPESHGDGAA